MNFKELINECKSTYVNIVIPSFILGAYSGIHLFLKYLGFLLHHGFNLFEKIILFILTIAPATSICLSITAAITIIPAGIVYGFKK